MTSEERIAQHAAAGLTRAVHPDAVRHFQAILKVLEIEYPPEVVMCPNCGRTGFPERVRNHDG